MVGTKSFVHRARKTKWSASPDVGQTFIVKGFVKKHFGVIMLTSENIKIPDGGYATYRRPDLYSKQHRLVIELDGEGVHGFGEILREKDDSTKCRFQQDCRQSKSCHVNSAQTDGYEEKLVIKILQDSGVFTEKTI